MAVSLRHIFITMALDSAPDHSSRARAMEPPHEEFERLHPFRSRGLDDLDDTLGDVSTHIRDRLASVRRLRVLEIGCGYGTTLVDLRVAFGDRLELHGINRLPQHGTWATARRSIARLGRLPDEEFLRLEPPTIHYRNLDDLFEFPDESFDFVVSQITFVYFQRKAEVLEDVNRILAPGGIARIDLMTDLRNRPVEYSRSFEIWDRGRHISFWDHASAFESLEGRMGGKRRFLEIRKSPSLRLGLEFVTSIDLKSIHSQWWGTKSVYRMAQTAN